MVFSCEEFAPTTPESAIMDGICTILGNIVRVLPFIAVFSSERLMGCM